MPTQSKKFGFKYRARSYDDIKSRANETGSNYDKYIVDGFKEFKPREGASRLRLMPPTWDDAKHYGFNIFLHYNIGPDKQAYLCLNKMFGNADPIEDERRIAVGKGQDEYARELSSRKRVLMWVIDRNNESDGPKLWSCPWTLDRDISIQSFDEMTKTALLIDDPVDGRDVSVERIGTGIGTKYVPKISHSDSELHASPKVVKKWLQFITDNPLPDCLKYYDYEYIENVFHGVKVSDSSEDEAVEDDVVIVEDTEDTEDAEEVRFDDDDDKDKKSADELDDDDGFEIERIKDRLSRSQERRRSARD